MQATFIYILLFNIIVSVAQRCTYSIELPKNAIVLFPTERSRRKKKLTFNLANIMLTYHHKGIFELRSMCTLKCIYQ